MSPTGQAVARLADRVAACRRLHDLYLAEATGLSLASTVASHVSPTYSLDDPALQERFLQGLADGRELLRIHGGAE